MPALISLYESIQGESEGTRPRYALMPIMKRQREAAGRLRVESHKDYETGHDRARARSLAYHRAIARRLRKSMVEDPRHTLFRWRAQGRIDPRYADEWERVLRQPVPEIRSAIIDESQRGDELRQSSPFAGMLSEPERQQILSVT